MSIQPRSNICNSLKIMTITVKQVVSNTLMFAKVMRSKVRVTSYLIGYFLDAPTVTIQQPSYSVTTGGSVTLVCTVTSNLAIINVQWQRNVNGFITTITSNTNTNKYSGSTTTTPSLTIFSASSSDVGTYTCIASNVLGTSQSTSTQLSVTGSTCMYF